MPSDEEPCGEVEQSETAARQPIKNLRRSAIFTFFATQSAAAPNKFPRNEVSSGEFRLGRKRGAAALKKAGNW